MAPSNTSRVERHHRRQCAEQRRQLGIAIERVRHDHLARLETGDLRPEPGAIAFGNSEFSGRDIDPAEREAVAGGGARRRDGEQVIVAPRIEQRVLGQRARRDQPDHVPAHHALGSALPRLGRILDLLADRDAMAERDQAVKILIGTVHRHAAHRDVAAEMLAALGEHDAERARGDLGILEEQLVEVAHPVEQQATRMGGLDLQILLHHRGGAAAVLGGRAGCKTGGRQRACGIHAARR